ncbi:hypothetical protein MKZ38_009842 [Zalerion maritima]|uniref:very-long-chain enoyl-CoA reductase n=1 Tax=Zalerion maritima TaxID=339359 RepID=A0AAD5WVD0_9PEZI|nr:hypothetical protein MKZ38_009842 [Zalerion maritima]
MANAIPQQQETSPACPPPLPDTPKKPIKKLPSDVEVPADATVEDVKVAVAGQARVGDFNRIGLFDPSTGKILKDRKAIVRELETVMKPGELLVKDLGPQIAWRTVFIIEYLGPILIHLGVVAARPFLYKGGSGPMSQTQILTFGMVIAHFVKRELETMFVHRFGASTMPAFNIFKNSAYYWLLSGVLVALFVYSPQSEAAVASNQLIDLAGFVVYMFSEISNAIVHLNLASLRPKGTTKKGIPTGYGFGLVTCPNYMFEVLGWIAVITVSRSWTVAVFTACGIWQMKQWAWQKEKAYRTQFGEKYKKHRYTMLPGLF